ncbi:hypothetical protein PRVXH_002048 [Proteinivorax hydrogeniformans]|uniref:DUF4293 family protein n=1 Tax=Proteinivorax hydrogeniformans TaxID=1826727 RepID=A0AAU8HRC4_9FIRM
MANKKFWRIFISFLLIINSCYFGLELYKEGIRNQWMENEQLNQEAFTELSRLGSWTYFIEVVLLIIIVTVAAWIIMKKHRKLLRFLTYINIAACVIFFGIGILLANIFEATAGNLVQHLIGPTFITVLLIIYQLVLLFMKKRDSTFKN